MSYMGLMGLASWAYSSHTLTKLMKSLSEVMLMMEVLARKDCVIHRTKLCLVPGLPSTSLILKE